MSPPSPPPNMQPLHDLDLSDRQWGVRRNRVEAILQHSRLLAGHPFSTLFVQDHATGQIIKNNVMGLLQRRGDLETPTETPPPKEGNNNLYGDVDPRFSMSLSKTQIEDDLMDMTRGSKVARPSRKAKYFDPHKKREGEVCKGNKISLSLTKSEIEEDFVAMTGSKVPGTPARKRGKKRSNKKIITSTMRFLLQPMMSTSPTIFSGASTGHYLLSPPSMGRQPLHNLDLSDRRWGCQRNRVEAVLLHRLAPMHRLSSPLLIKDHETALHTIKTRVMEHLGSLAEKGDHDTGLLDLSNMHGVSTEFPPKRIRFVGHNKEEEVVDTKMSMPLSKTQIEGDLMTMRGSRLVWPEVGILRREVRPDRHSKKAEVSNNKFSLCLTKKEIEDDFTAITGSKPHRRPEKKRSRKIQKKLDEVFPGLWLWK